jgi:leucyl/phenylalanyl-tRNA--protein transferase
MTLDADLLMHGYSIGIFPMAEHREDPEIFWVDPRRRGIFPLDGFHCSRSLLRTMRTTGFDISFDRAFADVVNGCADRSDTWINSEIRALYQQLHDRNQAHSVEIWDQGALVGGVYGVVLGSAFFGESMFSRRSNASKMALACLIDRLRSAGFTLFDTQFLTDHLASLGAIEISRAAYLSLLETAKSGRPDWNAVPLRPIHEVAQRITQMS